MQDIIFIGEIPTQAIIGVHSFEKAAPQKLLISVELGCDISKAAKTDDVQYALDYDAISQFVDKTVKMTTFNLLETLADHLVTQLFENFPMKSIKLTIQKPGAIVYTQKVGLTIYREKS